MIWLALVYKIMIHILNSRKFDNVDQKECRIRFWKERYEKERITRIVAAFMSSYMHLIPYACIFVNVIFFFFFQSGFFVEIFY